MNTPPPKSYAELLDWIDNYIVRMQERLSADERRYWGDLGIVEDCRDGNILDWFNNPEAAFEGGLGCGSFIAEFEERRYNLDILKSYRNSLAMLTKEEEIT